ncbi:MAG: branched-chain amino acid transport [Proteobacteria bacterium]|nr:MAG: branched-chain amino acid transport [Pseudomonadota bacterium]
MDNYWWLIIAMMALTFIPRYLPLALAGKIHIPPLLVQALEFVPIAVLTAIIVQTAVVRDGSVVVSIENHYLIASVAAFMTALLTRHLMLTIIVGLVVFSLLRLVM